MAMTWGIDPPCFVYTLQSHYLLSCPSKDHIYLLFGELDVRLTLGERFHPVIRNRRLPLQIFPVPSPTPLA